MNRFKQTGIYAAMVMGLATASFSHLAMAADGDVSIGYIDGETFKNKEVTYEEKNGRAVFEGDIVLGSVDEMDARSSGITANSIVVTREDKRWTDNTLPFEISADFPAEDLAGLQAKLAVVLQHYNANTNISLVERTAENADLYPDYVSVISASGCWSYVGKLGGRQTLGLSNFCSTGNIIHEFGHALGLWHEQSREDRDSHVEIQWENIVEGKEHNFNQHITDGDDIGGYDYGSIMHYPKVSFSVNGEPTIVPLDPDTEIGQRAGLSDGDIAALASIYPSLSVCAGLAAPEAINITNMTESGFTASWNAVSGADTYLLKTLADGEFKDYLASNATSHDFTGFVPGSSVGVRVQSQQNDCGVSSAIAFNFADLTTCEGAPGATDNVVFSDVEGTSFSVSWDAVEGADYYSVETVSEGVFTTYDNLTSTTQSFGDFEPGVYVGITIRAYSNACGSSEETETGLVKLVAGGSFEASNISGGWFAWNRYSVEVPEGMETLTINLADGSGNASLYVREGQNPSTSRYDCRSKNSGNGETCVISNPAAGTWNIGVYSGWSSVSGASLHAEWKL